jgi:GNAT superfamily N-acetyltransferase
VEDLFREPAALARRIERAQALQLERTRAARGSGGPPLEVAGGLAVFHGFRSPFSAAIGVGLAGAVGGDDVDRIEAHLGKGGGPVRVEVTPFSDPSLADELARRGYRLERFHQVWARRPLPLPAAPEAEVRPVRPGEERAWVELFSQAYLGGPTHSEAQREAFLAMIRGEGNVGFLAFANGSAAGIGIASVEGAVAYLSSAGVPAPYRGRGLQLALVRARLAWAAERGCDLAASATEPATASQRTLEKAGFRPAYPKAVLVRERPTSAS